VTKQEHTLMISMFVKQQMFIKMLIEVLRSRGLVSGDDLQAFEFSVNADMPATEQLFSDMTALYTKVATAMGIDTSL
jgi:hypothetical protein